MGISLVSHVEFGPSCQFKTASYLVWKYSEACLYLRGVPLAGRGSCYGSSVSSLQGGSSILLCRELPHPEWSMLHYSYTVH